MLNNKKIIYFNGLNINSADGNYKPNYNLVDKLLNEVDNEYKINEIARKEKEEKNRIDEEQYYLKTGMHKMQQYDVPESAKSMNRRYYNTNLDNKTLLDAIYQDVGGVDNLFQMRKNNGLNIEYNPDDYNKMLKNSHVNYNNNNNIGLRINPTLAGGYGVYWDWSKGIELLPFNSKNNVLHNDTFLHETTHSFQEEYPNINKLEEVNRDKIKKGISTDYWDNQNEIEARASGYLHDWQQKNNRILLTPEDLKDLMEKTKWNNFDKTTDMKKMFEKIIPTVASNRLTPYMENIG